MFPYYPTAAGKRFVFLLFITSVGAAENTTTIVCQAGIQIMMTQISCVETLCGQMS
jgi:hypothetical protein